MQPFLNLEVIQIIHETPDAVTIRFRPMDGHDISYHAGQFITLIFDFKGRELRRSFSLSSAPGIDPELAITVKRIPNGEISTYIYRHIRVGDTVRALLPSGRFVLEPDAARKRDIFFIAAGSGITPIFSVLKDLLHREPQSRLILIYSNRSERSTIFYEQLNEFAGQYGERFKCIYVFSEPEEASHPYRSHLNLELLRELIGQNLENSPKDAEFMLCGPFGFMRMAEMIIVAMGFDESRIHKENFVVFAEQEAINAVPHQNPGDKMVEIHYHSELIRLTVPAGKPILKTALEKGIYLPYSCQGGICGTCSAICTAGKVEMTVNEVLTQRELDKGWVLTCVGYPMTEKVALLVE